MPQCLLRSPLLPRSWADPRASQWTAQLYLRRFQAVSLATLRFQGFFDGWVFGAARAVAAIFWDGCRGVAQSGLGPVTVASWGCFQSFPGWFAALLAALEGAVAVSSSSSSQCEWVELESDHEPEPPCTMVETQGTDVFDLLAVARMRGLDEHELMHFVFEFGEEEGTRKMAELTEDDASSVVFQGGVVQEPRVFLALDELIAVTEVRQACEAPEPVKSVQILFRGEHGLEFGNCRLSNLLRSCWLFGAWAHGRGGVSSEALGR